MKKICFVTTVPGTIKAFILEMAKYTYGQGGYHITFICDYDEEFKASLPEYIKYIPVKMNRGINLTGIRATLNMYKIFKKEKFDMVQYSTPNASLYASIAAKLAGVPVRLYCQWGIVYVGFFGYKRRLFRLIEKLVCSLSTWIEPDSFGNLKFSLLEGLYTEKKSSVVWNGSASGVDLTKFNIKQKNSWRNGIRNKYKINEKTFVIGFVGRITKDKGINELLAACKEFFKTNSNSKIIIVGNSEKTEALDQELLKWSYIEDRVIYAGVTHEVEKYYAAMDVFVLPSYREGFGSVVIEAEAMGVPVIVTDIPGPTDAIINGVTGLVVKKEDVTSLFNAISTLYEDSELVERMEKEGYLFAKSKFDSEELKKHVLEDRERLLMGKSND